MGAKTKWLNEMGEPPVPICNYNSSCLYKNSVHVQEEGRGTKRVGRDLWDSILLALFLALPGRPLGFAHRLSSPGTAGLIGFKVLVQLSNGNTVGRFSSMIASSENPPKFDNALGGYAVASISITRFLDLGNYSFQRAKLWQ